MKLFWCLVSLFSLFSQGFSDWVRCDPNTNTTKNYPYLAKLTLRLQPKESPQLSCIQIDQRGVSQPMEIIHPVGDPNKLTCAEMIVPPPVSVWVRLPYLADSYLLEARTKDDTEYDTYCYWNYGNHTTITENSVRVLTRERATMIFRDGIYDCYLNIDRAGHAYKKSLYMWTCITGFTAITDVGRYYLTELSHCTEPISCQVIYFDRPKEIVESVSLPSIPEAPMSPAPSVEAVIVISDTNAQAVVKCVEEIPGDVYHQWFFIDGEDTSFMLGKRTNRLEVPGGEPLSTVSCYTYESFSYHSKPSNWTYLQIYVNTFRNLKEQLASNSRLRQSTMLTPALVIPRGAVGKVREFDVNSAKYKEKDKVMVFYMNQDTFLLCYRNYYHNGSRPIALNFRSSEIDNLKDYNYKALMGCNVTAVGRLTDNQGTPAHCIDHFGNKVNCELRMPVHSGLTGEAPPHIYPFNQLWVFIGSIVATALCSALLVASAYWIRGIMQNRSKKQINRGEPFLRPELSEENEAEL